MLIFSSIIIFLILKIAYHTCYFLCLVVVKDYYFKNTYALYITIKFVRLHISDSFRYHPNFLFKVYLKQKNVETCKFYFAENV